MQGTRGDSRPPSLLTNQRHHLRVDALEGFGQLLLQLARLGRFLLQGAPQRRQLALQPLLPRQQRLPFLGLPITLAAPCRLSRGLEANRMLNQGGQDCLMQCIKAAHTCAVSVPQLTA